MLQLGIVSHVLGALPGDNMSSVVVPPKAGSAKAAWGSLGVTVQSCEEAIASCYYTLTHRTQVSQVL